jgi:hypothetical protein
MNTLTKQERAQITLKHLDERIKEYLENAYKSQAELLTLCDTDDRRRDLEWEWEWNAVNYDHAISVRQRIMRNLH